jgi:hypothetical protein
MSAATRFRQVYSTNRFCQQGRAWSALRAAWLASLVALAGCATCRDHPVACGVVSAVMVGSIAATIVANEHAHHPGAPTRIVCNPGVTACGSAP